MDQNYDPLYPDHSVTDQSLHVWAQHRAFCNKPAFTWINERGLEESSLTYSALDVAASALAKYLHEEEGLHRQQGILLVLYPPGLAFIKVLFGCQRAGLTVAPILPPSSFMNASLSPLDIAKLESIVHELRPLAALAPSNYTSAYNKQCFSTQEKLSKLRWISINDTKLDNLSASCKLSNQFYGFDRNCYRGCSAHDIYLVQYTSGATGPPKPTLITAGAASHNARVARKAYDLSPSSIIASWLPQYHDCGLMFIHLSIITGATSILTSPFTFAKNPIIWLQMLSSYKANCTPVPAFALALVFKKHEAAISKGLVGLPPLDLSCLRNLIVVNEPIEEGVMEPFLAKFKKYGLSEAALAPSYGLAENCTFVSTAWAASDACSEGPLPTYNGLLPSARISTASDEEVEIRVVYMVTCKEAPEGVEGEVWVASPSNAVGYLGMPELTSQVFGATLMHGKGRRFVRTGDTGVNKGGFLYITGRVQDMLVLVDGAPGRHPHVIERTVQESASSALRPGGAVAFSVAPGALVVLAEVLDERVCPGPTVLHEICYALRRQHGVVPWFVALLRPRSLPKTTSGKLQRWKAKRLFTRQQMHFIECLSTTTMDDSSISPQLQMEPSSRVLRSSI